MGGDLDFIFRVNLVERGVFRFGKIFWGFYVLSSGWVRLDLVFFFWSLYF